MGTVMSGLSRARHALRSALEGESSRFNTPERIRARASESDVFRLPEAHAHATARALETALAAAGADQYSVREEENS